ncbi:unnamed protein product [Symbiodinium sp. CCMP2456]|nr:unnamed protein product [Symbiodinium sp. CCMP2456]
MPYNSLLLVLDKNISAVALAAFGGAPPTPWTGREAAEGLLEKMNFVFPTHAGDLDNDQVLFFRWNVEELLGFWIQYGSEWLDNLPSFSSRLLWQFYTCALPLRVFLTHSYRVFWPLIYRGLATKYQVAEPYRQLLVPDADLSQFSTHALVKRLALLQSLPVCDRECFLDQSAAFAALALQSGQRNQDADLLAYVADVQGRIQSAFCETLQDCMRTRPTAELLRTTVGFLHLIAELPFFKSRRLQALKNPAEVKEGTEFASPSLATLHTDSWGLPFHPSPADETEYPCIDKMDTEPISPARALMLYNMLNTVGQVLNHFGVQWFASHGTLLGAIRHGGVIPHDCDLDISIFSSDIHKMRSAALMLALQRNGYATDFLPVLNLFTVWRVGTHSRYEVRGPRAVNNMPRHGPALHIFVLFDFQETKRWVYDTDRLKHEGWKLRETDLLPLKFHSFGELTVPIPANSELYLNSMYGADWQTTIRCMTAKKELDYYGPTALKKNVSPAMAHPTGPLLEVFFD